MTDSSCDAGLHPGAIEEIVVAVREELKSLLPTLLASILDDLKDSNSIAHTASSESRSKPVIRISLEEGDDHAIAQGTNSIQAGLAVALHSPHGGYTSLQEQSCERLGISSSLIEEAIDPERVTSLAQELDVLDAKVYSANRQMEDLDTLWRNRRQLYESDVGNLIEVIREKREELEEALAPKSFEEPPPGPSFLRFVESTWFGGVCNAIISFNLLAMALQGEFKGREATFKFLDNLFLMWYILELATKAIYFQKTFLCGNISVVWWNYLDLCVVLGGVLDQLQQNESNLVLMRIFRLFRLFRLLRFLKILKVFLNSDLAWIDGSKFQGFMFCVIGLNCFVMGLELDVEWAGWTYIENLFLVVYSFELAVQLKHQRCGYFLDLDNAFFKYLDLVMVTGGVLNQWLTPLVLTIGNMLSGKSSHLDPHDGWSTALRLLRILRIVRVLRVIRLLRMIKPLHRVLSGIMQSIKAMQWVLVLTVLILYACSIVFTAFVGKGLLGTGHVGAEVLEYYGSMPRSMFSLFKLMNGDISVAEPITDLVIGRLLFVAFTVVSNWAVLAILTSVMSDNIISSSARLQEEDDAKERENDHAARLRRLMTIFQEIDDTGSGYIGKGQWNALLADKTLHREMKDASGLSEVELQDCFDCLALADTVGTHGMKLPYNAFLKILEAQGRTPDKSNIMHVVLQLRALESRLFAKLSQSRGNVLDSRLFTKFDECRGKKIQL